MDIDDDPVAPDPQGFEVWGGEVLGGVDRLALLRALRRAALRPAALARSTARLGNEAVRIAAGRRDVPLPAGDWRFAHAAWRENPAFHRLGQAYLAWAEEMVELVEDADVDWRTRARARFAMDLIVSALAPTNFLPTNPAALVRAFETGGASARKGMGNLLRDLRHNRGMPPSVDRRPFRLGETTAVTPGHVVWRDEVLELLQYAPATPEVWTRPVVVVPPQINRYYLLDMGPGRSFVEHAVAQGIQVFMVSWRNPRREHRDWGLDRYAGSLVEACEVARAITGTDAVGLAGVCAGGITSAGLLGHLAATDRGLVSSATFAVTLLDFAAPTGIGMLGMAQVVGNASKDSARRGYLDGRDLGALFAALRPNDLIWRYWVDGNLLGKDPAAFDVLAWNADTTRLPAGLHADFLDIFLDNGLAVPGGTKVLGTSVDLRKVDCDTFVVAAERDHLTPWRACFRTTHLLGGDVEFVLSSSGHIQSLVNPPGNPRMRYWTGPLDDDPDAWRGNAWEHVGSWWERWADWVGDRSGELRRAPRRPGSRRHPAIEPAPGRYVREQ